MLLFIGEENADRFLLTMGEDAKDISAAPLPSFDVLENLLRELALGGVTHVHFNAMPPGHPSPQPVPIGEVIASLEQRPR